MSSAEKIILLTDADRQAICDREYALFTPERIQLIKTELGAEARYEQVMFALSGGALALSVTLVKDWIGTDKAQYKFILLLSWICFASCLLFTLWHHKLTYETHRDWRKILDEEFDTPKWKPGAMTRALARYDSIPHIKLVEKLKPRAFLLLVLGIGFLGLFLAINYGKEKTNGNTTSEATRSIITASTPSPERTANTTPAPAATTVAPINNQ